jgi:hypothetical protein
LFEDQFIILADMSGAKDRIAEHLQQHAGDPDLLDSLIEQFGGHGAPSFGSTPGGPPLVAGVGARYEIFYYGVK